MRRRRCTQQPAGGAVPRAKGHQTREGTSHGGGQQRDSPLTGRCRCLCCSLAAAGRCRVLQTERGAAPWLLLLAGRIAGRIAASAAAERPQRGEHPGLLQPPAGARVRQGIAQAPAPGAAGQVWRAFQRAARARRTALPVAFQGFACHSSSYAHLLEPWVRRLAAALSTAAIVWSPCDARVLLALLDRSVLSITRQECRILARLCPCFAQHRDAVPEPRRSLAHAITTLQRLLGAAGTL